MLGTEATLAALGWSDWLAVGAFVVSVVSGVVAVASVIYTRRADQRAERAERRDVHRDTRDQEQATAARSAELIVTPHGSSRESEASRHYHFSVQNIGQAAAHTLVGWLENDQNERVSNFTQTRTLLPSEATNPPLVATTAIHDPEQLMIVLSWKDAAATHERAPTGVHPTA